MRRSRMFMLVALAGCTGLSSDPSGPKRHVYKTLDVPPAIAAALAHLDSVLSPADRARFRHLPSDSIIFLRYSTGLWDNVGLWSAVAESLRARGVQYPEDMSLLILRAYRVYVRGERIDLGALVGDLPPPPTGFKVLRFGSP